MADKLKKSTTVPVEFVAGERPTAGKFNALSRQAQRGFQAIEFAIGDIHNQSRATNTPYFTIPYGTRWRTQISLSMPPFADTDFQSKFVTGALDLGRPLDIVNMARLIGPAGNLNPQALTQGPQEILELLDSETQWGRSGNKKNQYALRYPPILATASYAGPTFDSPLLAVPKVSPADLEETGDYHITPDGVIHTYSSLNDVGPITCTYHTDSLYWGGGPNYIGATFNVIPDPNQLIAGAGNGIGVTGPELDGGYLLTLPVVTHAQKDYKGEFTELTNECDYDTGLQLTLPEWMTGEDSTGQDFYTPGTGIPEGTVYLKSISTNEVYTDAEYIYDSPTTLRMRNVDLGENGCNLKFCLITVGTDITTSIDDLRRKQFQHSHDRKFGEPFIHIESITGQLEQGDSPDSTYVNATTSYSGPYYPSKIPGNHFPQYMHRDGFRFDCWNSLGVTNAEPTTGRAETANALKGNLVLGKRYLFNRQDEGTAGVQPLSKDDSGAKFNWGIDDDGQQRSGPGWSGVSIDSGNGEYINQDYGTVITKKTGTSGGLICTGDPYLGPLGESFHISFGGLPAHPEDATGYYSRSFNATSYPAAGTIRGDGLGDVHLNAHAPQMYRSNYGELRIEGQGPGIHEVDWSDMSQQPDLLSPSRIDRWLTEGKIWSGSVVDSPNYTNAYYCDAAGGGPVDPEPGLYLGMWSDPHGFGTNMSFASHRSRCARPFEAPGTNMSQGTSNPRLEDMQPRKAQPLGLGMYANGKIVIDNQSHWTHDINTTSQNSGIHMYSSGPIGLDAKDKCIIFSEDNFLVNSRKNISLIAKGNPDDEDYHRFIMSGGHLGMTFDTSKHVGSDSEAHYQYYGRDLNIIASDSDPKEYESSSYGGRICMHAVGVRAGDRPAQIILSTTPVANRRPPAVDPTLGYSSYNLKTYGKSTTRELQSGPDISPGVVSVPHVWMNALNVPSSTETSIILQPSIYHGNPQHKVGVGIWDPKITTPPRYCHTFPGEEPAVDPLPDTFMAKWVDYNLCQSGNPDSAMLWVKRDVKNSFDIDVNPGQARNHYVAVFEDSSGQWVPYDTDSLVGDDSGEDTNYCGNYHNRSHTAFLANCGRRTLAKNEYTWLKFQCVHPGQGGVQGTAGDPTGSGYESGHSLGLGCIRSARGEGNSGANLDGGISNCDERYHYPRIAMSVQNSTSDFGCNIVDTWSGPPGLTGDNVRQRGDIQFVSGGADYGEAIAIGDPEEWGSPEARKDEGNFGIPEGRIVWIRNGHAWKDGTGTPMAVTARAVIVGNESTKIKMRPHVVCSFIGQVPLFVDKIPFDNDLLIPVKGQGHCTSVSKEEATFEQYKSAIGTVFGNVSQEDELAAEKIAEGGFVKIMCAISIK